MRPPITIPVATPIPPDDQTECWGAQEVGVAARLSLLDWILGQFSDLGHSLTSGQPVGAAVGGGGGGGIQYVQFYTGREKNKQQRCKEKKKKNISNGYTTHPRVSIGRSRDPPNLVCQLRT